MKCRPSCRSSSRGFQARRDTFPPKKCANRDQDNPEQPDGRRSSHSWGGSSLRTAKAGKTSDPRPLLGIETGATSLPCTVSVPNLKTDRPILMAGSAGRRQCAAIDVSIADMVVPVPRGLRRIRAASPRRSTPRFCSAPRMRWSTVCGRNAEPDRDFLRRQMLVDERQAIELALAQPRNSLLPRFKDRAVVDPATCSSTSPLAPH